MISYSLTDCDDTNADIKPGLDEVFGNDIDENCDGFAELDLNNETEFKHKHEI